METYLASMVLFAKNDRSRTEHLNLKNFPICQENTKFGDISDGSECQK